MSMWLVLATRIAILAAVLVMLDNALHVQTAMKHDISGMNG